MHFFTSTLSFKQILKKISQINLPPYVEHQKGTALHCFLGIALIGEALVNL